MRNLIIQLLRDYRLLVPLALTFSRTLLADPCIEVADDQTLKKQLTSAKSGAQLCLKEGVYHGPITIDRGLRVSGPRTAVIRSSGQGSTVRMVGVGSELRGVTVDGSGARYDLQDAGVRIEADRVVLRGVFINKALFGIISERVNAVHIEDNIITGVGEEALGLRGDAIRLWETRRSSVVGNRVSRSRDIVVWYSSGNSIRNNEVRESRYATHLMYSHDNEVVSNRYLDNTVGIFIMYSRNVRIAHNLLGESGGAAGYSIGIKESGNIEIRENDLVASTTGLYLDTSPFDPADSNQIESNRFVLCDTAIIFHSSPRRNRIVQNDFIANRQLLRVDGGGDATETAWQSNYYDEYEGYDLDRDQVGDVAFESRRLTTELISVYPALAFFRGTLAFASLNAIAEVFPLYRPKLMLVDKTPAMTPNTRRGG